MRDKTSICVNYEIQCLAIMIDSAGLTTKSVTLPLISPCNIFKPQTQRNLANKHKAKTDDLVGFLA